MPTQNHGAKRTKNLRLIVIHSAVMDTKITGAENLAKYLESGAGGRKVSWHYSVDPDSIAASLDEDYIGYHCGSATVHSMSLGIEQSAQSPDDWASPLHQLMLDQVARLIADICYRHKISPEPLSGAQLKEVVYGTDPNRAYTSGIVSHRLVNKNSGIIDDARSSHTDPGIGYPWGQLWELSKNYLAQYDTPPVVDPGVVEPSAPVLADEILYTVASRDPYSFVEAIYMTVLKRSPSYSEVVGWLKNYGVLDRAAAEKIAFGIINSVEANRR